jgi:hypothetical protein
MVQKWDTNPYVMLLGWLRLNDGGNTFGNLNSL